MLHVKIVRVDGQSDLLSLGLRVQRVIHDGQVLHGDVVGADGQSPCAEGVVLLSVGVDLVRVVVPYDACFIPAGAANLYAGHEYGGFYTKIALRKLNKVTREA